jgi:hypothetical protein
MAKEPKEKEPVQEGQEIGDALKAALEAHGVDPRHVLSSRHDAATGVVIFVTNGGKKVQWKEGEKAASLSEIEITGVNPENAKRRPITGAKK